MTAFKMADRVWLPLALGLLLSACSAISGLNAGRATEESAFPQPTEIDAEALATAVAAELRGIADAEYALLSRLYEDAAPSVVSIQSVFVDESNGGEEIRRGSGFIYDRQGHIVTNAHLVKGADRLSVTLENGAVVTAATRGLDSFSDVAALRIEADADSLIPLRIGESAALKVGQRALSIGSPFGLDKSLTMGIVSGLGRSLRSAELIDGDTPPGFDNPGIIQIDAPVHPGASGGPLLDSGGFVMGMITAIRTDNGAFQGVGFAVPADTLRRVVPELIEYGSVDYAWVGLSVMPEDGGFGVAGLSAALGLSVDRGVLLKGVARGSPAQQAGLRGGTEWVTVRGVEVCAGGDVIVAVNGAHIRDLGALNAWLIQQTRPGDEIELLIVRENETLTINLTLQSRPAESRDSIGCEPGG